MPPPSTSQPSNHYTTNQGPNPSYIEASYHWFDGSGFVHALSLDPAAQSANYSAQFVETAILKVRLFGLTVCIVYLSVGFDYFEFAFALLVVLSLVGHAHCLQYPPAFFYHPGGPRREAPVTCLDGRGGFGLYGSAKARLHKGASKTHPVLIFQNPSERACIPRHPHHTSHTHDTSARSRFVVNGGSHISCII